MLWLICLDLAVAVTPAQAAGADHSEFGTPMIFASPSEFGAFLGVMAALVIATVLLRTLATGETPL